MIIGACFKATEPVSLQIDHEPIFPAPISDFVFFPCRLSKELQHKDKLIESLHTKLRQRPETPSSCHALSETTDQSDRTSLVSDEYQSNDDLELCSDMVTTEFQEEHRLRQQGHATEPDGIFKLLN